MPYLLVVSLIWALSFPLIKGNLAGVDSAFVTFARVAIALLVFLPFVRPQRIGRLDTLALLGIGALQFGLMYLAYLEAFKYLQAHEIALFTVTTPLFVAIFADALAWRWQLRSILAASLAVAGSAVIVYRPSGLETGAWTGFLLMQASNACFALGQVLYRRFRARHPEGLDRELFAWLYLGAALLSLPAAWTAVGPSVANLTFTHVWTLLYLGALASGLCFFWWNVGATRVSTGSLAVFNNLKIPLGVIASMLALNESADPWRLAIGCGAMVAALALAEAWSWTPRRPRGA
jgi:drug/metabolite transporter (DMT)-like permease